MFCASDFHEIVSGRRKGARAGLLRGTLQAGEWFYTAAVQWRNRRYDRGVAAVWRMDVPVLSVGNLTLGGTGKTPMVRWLTRWFGDRGTRVAVISRGYGARAGQANDEALELQRSLPKTPHLQNPDRVAAARDAVERFQSQVIVLDDAFQHRRMGRDLDIVLLDALEPFGFGHVFPRGTLREPIAGLRRADVVILSRADHLDEAARAAVWHTVDRYAPQALRAEAVHAPWRLSSAGGVEISLDSVHGQSVVAFCGIGNPAGFRHTLDTCGCRLVGFREFPDHHAYSLADLDSLSAWARQLDASVVLCTGKDLAKLSADRLGNCPLWAVDIELEFVCGQQPIESRLQAMCPAV